MRDFTPTPFHGHKKATSSALSNQSCSCKKKVKGNDNVMQCDNCDKLFHIGYINMPISSYQAYQQLATNKQYSNWYCFECSINEKSSNRTPRRCLQ
ncbi:unnamed protein product [Didymodactylos carnosus]|uniref:Zinc finger PHD-type domain-containing protein n=1 Tax=Didymodactylos carnosus TaxID=1234261 RepID=A0A814CR13_9BILA|nr:unnamed protein product [Didymodactylos carnosus]CAF1110062.1 unnamed protein product [Didymodactylos carnosus]CAF3720465.1 unnamed protein product [Didymodactylos carnosus]CAF3876628.1 unnamed protein product [Didymodactylos carnosus]